MNGGKPRLAERICSGVKLLVSAFIVFIYCYQSEALFGAAVMLTALYSEYKLPFQTADFSFQHAVLSRPLEEQILDVPFFHLHYQISLREDALSIIEVREDPDEMRRYRIGQKVAHLLDVFRVFILLLFRTHIWIHLAVALVRQLWLPVWPVLCGLAVLMLAEHHIWRRDIYLLHIESEALMAALDQKILTMPADQLKTLYWQREDIEKRYL